MRAWVFAILVCGACKSNGPSNGTNGGAGAATTGSSTAVAPVGSEAPSAPVSAAPAPAPAGVRGVTLPEWAHVVGVRNDRRAALLRFGDKVRPGDKPFHANDGHRFQWLDLETLSLDAGSEWEEREWAALAFAPAASLDEKLASPALAADVDRHARAVASLLDPREDKVVAGKTFALAEVGDRLFRIAIDVDGGTPKLEGAVRGGYGAAIGPTGNTMYFVPDHDSYALVSTGAKPMMKTGIVAARPVLSSDGAFAYVRGGEGSRCLVRIDIKTAVAKELACLPPALLPETLHVSPSARVAVLAGRNGENGNERTVLAIDLPEGTTRGTFRRGSSVYGVNAVTDDGILVGHASGTNGGRISLIDPKSRIAKLAVPPTGTHEHDCRLGPLAVVAWITPSRFLTEDAGRVSTCELPLFTYETEPYDP